jgi:hypothetical protein
MNQGSKVFTEGGQSQTGMVGGRSPLEEVNIKEALSVGQEGDVF